MARRGPLAIILVAFVVVAPLVAGETARSSAANDVVRGRAEPYRADGWIKLCGLSLGCRIDPPPHPWLGRNIYNATGRRQTVSVNINEGEGVRFWITVQNDGTEADTIRVRGCRGNRTFEVNRVLRGKHKRQDPRAPDLTRKYRRGTLRFDLGAGDKVVFTLNIITHFNKGLTYRCRTELHPERDPTLEDVVVAKMTTY